MDSHRDTQEAGSQEVDSLVDSQEDSQEDFPAEGEVSPSSSEGER